MLVLAGYSTYLQVYCKPQTVLWWDTPTREFYNPRTQVLFFWQKPQLYRPWAQCVSKSALNTLVADFQRRSLLVLQHMSSLED